MLYLQGYKLSIDNHCFIRIILGADFFTTLNRHPLWAFDCSAYLVYLSHCHIFSLRSK